VNGAAGRDIFDETSADSLPRNRREDWPTFILSTLTDRPSREFRALILRSAKQNDLPIGKRQRKTPKASTNNPVEETVSAAPFCTAQFILLLYVRFVAPVTQFPCGEFLAGAM